jgi:heme oxygenase (mycobilin-producing)
MSIARIGHFTGRPGQIDELKDFLISIIPMITSSEGRQSVQLYQSQENPTSFTMIEVWESVESHQASVRNIPPEKLAEIRPLLGSAPGGSYYELVSAA